MRDNSYRRNPTNRHEVYEAIFSDANTAEAVELQETAPPRERRSPMRHDVARRVQFGTALVHSMDGITASQWTCLARARDTEKANSYQLNSKAATLVIHAHYRRPEDSCR